MKRLMTQLAGLVTVVAAINLTGCGTDDNHPAPTTPAPDRSATTAEPSTMNVESDTVANVRLQCGAAQASLTATGPTSTQASFTRAGQPAQALAIPEALHGNSAIGLGCTTAADGTAFLVVQYGELPYGCKFCEWYALYDSNGQLLTQNTPALLGEGEQRQPNNQQYEQLLAQHGLQHPAMEFVGQ